MCLYVERVSSPVECPTRNQVSPVSNPNLLRLRRLGVFVLFIVGSKTILNMLTFICFIYLFVYIQMSVNSGCLELSARTNINTLRLFVTIFHSHDVYIWFESIRLCKVKEISRIKKNWIELSPTHPPLSIFLKPSLPLTEHSNYLTSFDDVVFIQAKYTWYAIQTYQY